MTLTPGPSAPHVAVIVLRLAALLFMTNHIGAFAQILPELRILLYEGGHQGILDPRTAVLAAYLFAISACVLIFWLAPALVAWSQVGASRTEDADTGWDRSCRATILVTALILFMPGLYDDAWAVYNMLYFLATHSFVEETLVGHWLATGPLYPLTAVAVILLSPALGAALNAARRALTRTSQRCPAASTGDPS